MTAEEGRAEQTRRADGLDRQLAGVTAQRDAANARAAAADEATDRERDRPG